MKLYQYVILVCKKISSYVINFLSTLFRAFPYPFPTSSLSFSTTTTSEARRYDVFLSFRGEDTRNGFTSHLHEALCKNQILTFIDNNLRRGDDISPSLLTTIEESMVSVIIFSENYADSKWCLKELAKIIQCRKLNDQIVIPVFYGVDPSDIRKQTGKFGLAFDKRKERLREGGMDLDDVRSHLEEAANISGWNSQIISPESKLIKSIVGDILNKFNRMTFNLPSSLVGIGSHVKRVETLLSLESPQFRIVGLRGMGGIGKTTIARAVFKRICTRFDAFHFVENVSNEIRNQSVDGLREKIVLKLLEEEFLNIGNRTLQDDFIIKQLQRKKVLIVLDDVDDAIEAKTLLAGMVSRGSRILVTSRNNQVLKNIVDDKNLIYEVEGLNEEDGVQLFSLGAFKQNHPTSDRLELSKRVFNYSRGNPLALVVLGHALFDKSKEEWDSALGVLGDEPFPNIQKVLRISYDALSNEEKTIFLDISAFLVGKKLDFVEAYYEGSVKRIKFKISNLADKSLITIAKDEQLEMHDLLKEMGRFIESDKSFEERIRIWNLKDLINVSKKMKACDYRSRIEAISVNLCQGEKISEFDCSVLARLDRLKFLEFHDASQSKVKFCWERFRGFSEELRYFRWDAYPHESLSSSSSSFCAENLVELHMPLTATRKLWTGKQNIVNLKVINFEGAKKLVEFPDVSEGRNIERINLGWCKRLVKLPPSVQHLPKLELLNLQFCSSVESVPTTFDSKVLKILDLSFCRGVKMFPQVASQGNSIRGLILDETNIREVPSSVELLKGLEKLSMRGCRKLSIISTNICKLKSLSKLNLTDCTNLESFPEIMEPMESLTGLNLGGCTRLERLPNDHSFHNLKSLEELYLNDTAIIELPSSIQHLICLQKLRISGCQNLTSLPSFIHNQRMLELDLKGCSNLCYLPELPSSLETLEANGCVSLKTISSACFASESKTRILKFANCFNWDEEERRRVLDNAFSILQYILDPQEYQEERALGLDITSSDFEFLDIARKIWNSLKLQSYSSKGIQEERTIGLDIASSIFQEIQEERTIGLDIASSNFEKIQKERTIGLDIASSLLELLDIARKWWAISKLESYYSKTSQEGHTIGLDIASSIFQEYQEERTLGLDIASSNFEEIKEVRTMGLVIASSILETIQEGRPIGLDIDSSISEEGRTIGLDIDSSIFEKIEEEFGEKLREGLDLLSSFFEKNWDPSELESYSKAFTNDQNFEIILPWSEIPQWFWDCQSVGSFLTVRLIDDQCYRLVFCVVIKPNYSNSVGCNHMYCHVDFNDAWVTSCEFNLEPSDTEHLLLWYPGDIALREYVGREVTFQFRDKKGEVEVTKCGVLILSVEDIRNAESSSSYSSFISNC